MRYWAIRVGDSIVIKVGRKTPTIIRSKLTKTIVNPKRTPIYYAPGFLVGYEEKGAKRTVTREQVFYAGGKFLGVCKLHEFKKRTGLYVRTIQEITKAQRMAALKGEV